MIKKKGVRKKTGKSEKQFNISEARACVVWGKVWLEHEDLVFHIRKLGLYLEGN